MTEDFAPRFEAKAVQCDAVLAALREGPKTTTDLRALCVMSPAARVMDLRRAGVPILTLRSGRQARYELAEGGAQ